MIWCKLFGCNIVKKETAEPIDVLFKILYTSYDECKRCNRKTNLTVYLF